MLEFLKAFYKNNRRAFVRRIDLERLKKDLFEYKDKASKRKNEVLFLRKDLEAKEIEIKKYKEKVRETVQIHNELLCSYRELQEAFDDKYKNVNFMKL